MSAGLTRILPEIIRRAVAVRLSDMHACLPGNVQSYDAAKNLAAVQVMVKHPVFDDDGRVDEYEDIGVLIDVPVRMPRAGGFIISLPLAAGDEGELHFHSTPIGEWRASGNVGEPQDASRFSIGWPTFCPDLFNDANPIASGDLSNRQNGIVIGKEGSSEQILIQGGLIQAGTTGADFVALAGLVHTELGKIAGALTAVANGGGSVTGANTYTVAGNVASALFKAK